MPLDSRVASVLDKSRHDGNEDEDALIEELENDESLDGFRERRIQQLHEEFSRAKVMRAGHFGTYQELKDEKAILDLTTSTKLCVVHFFRSDFNRCRIMDTHMGELAPVQFDTRFVRINVDNAPFLVVRLKVQVLPCVIAFKDGIAVDRIVGFEGLGSGNDSFTTGQLETRLLQCGVLTRARQIQSTSAQTLAERQQRKLEEDEDDFDEYE